MKIFKNTAILLLVIVITAALLQTGALAAEAGSTEEVLLTEAETGSSADVGEENLLIETAEEPEAADEVSLSEPALFEQVQSLENRLEESGIAYRGFLVTLKKNARNLAKDGRQTKPAQFVKNVCVAQSAEDIANDYDYEDIVRIEPNYISRPADEASPNDTFFLSDDQAYLDLIRIPYAWSRGLNGKIQNSSERVVVAVIDSGIYREHEDLDSSHILAGYNFAGTYSSDLSDVLGHGTACASVIMASRNNGTGIAGIVPDVYILPIRIFYYDSSAEGYVTDDNLIASSIRYAADNGADVISMSMSGPGTTTVKEEAVRYAADKGILMIASAGNSDDGHTCITYPAGYNSVIGVGSVDSAKKASYFSQSNSDSVFCTAQGEQIVTAGISGPDEYLFQNGTSFSCPQVAAIAAIAKSIDPDITPAEFKILIRDTCTDLGPSGKDADYGYGLVNAEKIINKLLPVKSLALNKAKVVLELNQTVKLKATVKPSNAAVKTVTWKSSDAKTVRVSKTGTVRGLKPGSEIITAVSDADAKIKAKCRITVLFADVGKSSRYYKQVHWALVKDLTRGAQGKFMPGKQCTRKDMIIFLWKLAGSPAVSGTLPFSDTDYSKKSASYQAILWGYQQGLVRGYSDGTFRPGRGLTRNAAVVMLYRYAGKPASEGEMKFTDVKGKGDSCQAVRWAANEGIAGGYSDGTFRPSDTCTRGHAITFLYRYAH